MQNTVNGSGGPIAASSPFFSYGIAIAAPVIAAVATGALWTWLHPAVSLFFSRS